MRSPPPAISITITCCTPRARADLLRRLGSPGEAAKSYTRALEIVTNDAERRLLERRLREVRQQP